MEKLTDVCAAIEIQLCRCKKNISRDKKRFDVFRPKNWNFLLGRICDLHFRWRLEERQVVFWIFCGSAAESGGVPESEEVSVWTRVFAFSFWKDASIFLACCKAESSHINRTTRKGWNYSPGVSTLKDCACFLSCESRTEWQCLNRNLYKCLFLGDKRKSLWISCGPIESGPPTVGPAGSNHIWKQIPVTEICQSITALKLQCFRLWFVSQHS